MNPYTWKQRLQSQLPGWAVWFARGSAVSVQWHAAPAAPGTHPVDYWWLPNQVGAATPQELRALARDRYGWDDHCETCGVLARECGHRQPEREGVRKLARKGGQR